MSIGVRDISNLYIPMLNAVTVGLTREVTGQAKEPSDGSKNG
jgi:hypothetical protein